MVRILAGTSGYSYKEWKGNFYPAKLANTDMLEHYGKSLQTVEINNTFYRMPKKSVLETWRAKTPADFRFAIKASRRITHVKRLNQAEEETGYLCDVVRSLGDKLGTLLFQLPPFFKKDLEVLTAFLDGLPDDIPAAFEFRHPSWADDKVLDVLGDHNCAWCVTDKEGSETSLHSSARWGYLRLRQPDYTPTQMGHWAKQIQQQSWDRAYVFFKHEEEGAAPRMAKELIRIAGE